MGIGKGSTAVERDKVMRCWEDRWVEGSFTASMTGGNLTPPWSQEWTITVDAKACAQCFCNDCKTSSCAEKDREEESCEGHMDTYSDDDGSLDTVGRFLIRPFPPIRRGLCLTRTDIETGLTEKTCGVCGPCIPWEPEGGSTTVDVYFDTEDPTETEVVSAIQDELRMAAVMANTPDILGAWVGCDCESFVKISDGSPN
tara:strand:+ start:144 stop:740 length:597 start_codon:yes stop_codon:yes gene_type:complete